MIVTFVKKGALTSSTADLQASILEPGRFEVWSEKLVCNATLIFMPQVGARYQEWFVAVAEAIGYGERAAVFVGDASIRLVFGGGFSATIHANGECFIGNEPFHVVAQESICKPVGNPTTHSNLQTFEFSQETVDSILSRQTRVKNENHI